MKKGGGGARLWGERRKRRASLRRSCRQLNEALAWKHLQHVQVEQIHHPRGRKMKKITVNSSQLGAVGGRSCHTRRRGWLNRCVWVCLR